MEITKEQVALWIQHPVTQELIKVLTDLKQANEGELTDRLLNHKLSGQEEQLLQLKGQILTLSEVINVKDLLYSEIDNQEWNKADLNTTKEFVTKSSEVDHEI